MQKTVATGGSSLAPLMGGGSPPPIRLHDCASCGLQPHAWMLAMASWEVTEHGDKARLGHDGASGWMHVEFR